MAAIKNCWRAALSQGIVPAMNALARANNISDLRALARRRLPRPIFDYIDGGADDELTLRRNSSAFSDYELVPDVLTDVSSIATETTAQTPCWQRWH